MDWLTIPEDDLFARLEAQPGRRVVKTHTPLDGVVLDRRATYVVVARDPLDMAVSLYHQGDNLDRERIAELTGRPYTGPVTRPPLDEWLRGWTLRETDPMVSMDSLQGVVHHAADAWDRRDDDQVLVLRYEDLVADLAGWMGWLAGKLRVEVDPARWPALVDAASFGSMRAGAASRTPDRRGVLKDPAAFFRRGRPGAGREVLAAGRCRGLPGAGASAGRRGGASGPGRGPAVARGAGGLTRRGSLLLGVLAGTLFVSALTTPRSRRPRPPRPLRRGRPPPRR